MPRRKKSKGLEGLLEDTAALPWQAGLGVALAVYVLLRYLIPLGLDDGPIGIAIGRASANMAWMFTLLFVGAAAVSAFKSRGSRKLLERNRNLADIRGLSWREFERLIAQSFREQGYSVIENDGPGADGGIDVRLRRSGETTIVQCKHYRNSRVGVAVIREMLGVQVSEEADATMVVTTGKFTQEARAFAEKNGIRLYDGAGLMQLTGGVSAPLTLQPIHDANASEPEIADHAAPLACPTCGATMALRTARKGPHAGSQFYGCSTFPACRGIRTL